MLHVILTTSHFIGAIPAVINGVTNLPGCHACSVAALETGSSPIQSDAFFKHAWEDGWMNGWVGGWMNGWVGGWMNGWVGGGMNGWVGEWMEE